MQAYGSSYYFSLSLGFFLIIWRSKPGVFARLTSPVSGSQTVLPLSLSRQSPVFCFDTVALTRVSQRTVLDTGLGVPLEIFAAPIPLLPGEQPSVGSIPGLFGITTEESAATVFVPASFCHIFLYASISPLMRSQQGIGVLLNQ